MKALFDLVERGGPVMIAIIVLSVVLYTRCFGLLVSLRQQARKLEQMPRSSADHKLQLRRHQSAVREEFLQNRLALGAMIAAAPLLGLLGTVCGMVTTFESLSVQTGQKSMEGLARGISEVLVATESGLAVALPALLLVYLAHREMHRIMQQLNQQEGAGLPALTHDR